VDDSILGVDIGTWSLIKDKSRVEVQPRLLRNWVHLGYGPEAIVVRVEYGCIYDVG
jgi:hypothetical protein